MRKIIMAAAAGVASLGLVACAETAEEDEVLVEETDADMTANDPMMDDGMDTELENDMEAMGTEMEEGAEEVEMEMEEEM